MDLASAKMIGAGLATLGMIGAGVGVGMIWSALINAGARNPQALEKVTLFGWIGFAVTEAIAILAWVIAAVLAFA